MTDPQPEPLRSFLATFDADDLGDGDLNAGTNTLAAMASMIANIAPPGSGLLDPQGHRTRVGASLLVSGSLSSCLVIDEAITELGMLQDHLTAHLGSYLRQKEEEALRPGSVEEPSGPTPNHSERALAGLVDSGEFNLTSPAQEWLKVLSDPPSARLEDHAIRPKVFVTAVRVAELEGQLRGLQMGSPNSRTGSHRPRPFPLRPVSPPPWD